MALHTYNIKAIGPSGVVWQGSVDKVDGDGNVVAIDPGIIKRGIREVVGYKGSYRLVVK